MGEGRAAASFVHADFPLTANRSPDNIILMGNTRASGGRWGRVSVALALIYLLLLKSLFLPFPGLMMPDALGPFGAFVICAHDGSSAAIAADDKGGVPASHHDNCCDEGCLMRVAALAPLILVASLILFSRIPRWIAVLRRPVCAASGPPWRIASRPQAPRAPPQLCFV
jgi:hypothetical protein